MAFPAYPLLILKMLHGLLEHAFLRFMAGETERGVILLQEQHFHQSVAVMTFLAILGLKRLMCHFVAESLAHFLMAIETRFSKPPARRSFGAIRDKRQRKHNNDKKKNGLTRTHGELSC